MIKELEYILKIAEERSISRAAVSLCMSQSSLSQFLSVFEAELGTTLFIRSSSGTRPTYSGELFLQYARHAVLEYHQMQNQLWDVNDLQCGIIRLAVATARGMHLIPPILKSFLDDYPGIHVEITETNSNETLPLLMDASVDIALLAISRSLPKVPTEFLRREEIFIVASIDHPVLRYAKPLPGEPEKLYIEPEDAAQFDFILTSPNTVLRTITEDLFAEHRLSIRCRYDNLTLDFAMAMAEQGIGLLFSHESLIRPDQAVVCLSIGPDRLWRDLVLAFPSSHYRSRATKAFAARIHEKLDIRYS